MPFDGKVFCLGAFRTGTCSLAAALRILGLKVCESHEKLRWGLRQFREGATQQPYQTLLERFDALAQQPVALQYRLLYQHYPEAKYILTWREPKEWLFSRAVLIMDTWFHNNKDHDREFKPQAALGMYEHHNKGVRSFFRVKPGSGFMEMHVTEGDGWAKLCSFLDMPVPEQEFPHVNGAGFLLRRMLKERKKDGQ